MFALSEVRIHSAIVLEVRISLESRVAIVQDAPRVFGLVLYLDDAVTEGC